MEAETTASATAATGGEAVGGYDFQAMLDGEAPAAQPETSTPAEPTPTPETQETTADETQQPETPVDAKPEDQPADQTAEEFSEPLPGKLGKLLETLGKDQKTADLARQIRADHEALNGPEGFRGMFRTVEEARDYKTIAPTVDDLKLMSDYSERYDYVDRLYTSDPVGLIRTLAEDAPAFQKVAETLEPAIRQLNDRQLYETAAKPFNQNFWRNVMDTVREAGTPEEIQLFQAFEQKYLGALGRGQSQPTSQFQNTPEWRELQELRAMRDGQQGRNFDSFFQDVNRDVTPGLRAEVRKYLDEKVGNGIPKDVRDEVLDEMAGNVANQIFKEINGNPIVAGELNRMIEGGNLSPQHKAQVIERIMTRGKAWLPQKSSPEIQRVMGRIRKLAGGNGNTKPITDKPSKDVGSGSPTVGAAKSGPMPKGAPPGFNNMKPEDQSKYINWRAMGDEGDQLVIEANMSGDWSKVIMKG